MATRCLIALSLAASTVALVSGCRSNTARARDSQVREDPTPELETLSRRDIDIANQRALTYDENWRMFNEDWNRFWLVDRPSRLSRTRIPH